MGCVAHILLRLHACLLLKGGVEFDLFICRIWSMGDKVKIMHIIRSSAVHTYYIGALDDDYDDDVEEDGGSVCIVVV